MPPRYQPGSAGRPLCAPPLLVRRRMGLGCEPTVTSTYDRPPAADHERLAIGGVPETVLGTWGAIYGIFQSAGCDLLTCGQFLASGQVQANSAGAPPRAGRSARSPGLTPHIPSISGAPQCPLRGSGRAPAQVGLHDGEIALGSPIAEPQPSGYALTLTLSLWERGPACTSPRRPPNDRWAPPPRAGEGAGGEVRLPGLGRG
jgi:hypothetical protein